MPNRHERRKAKSKKNGRWSYEYPRPWLKGIRK